MHYSIMQFNSSSFLFQCIVSYCRQEPSSSSSLATSSYRSTNPSVINMHYSTILVGALAALATAQSTASNVTSASARTPASEASASASSAQAQIDQCVKACSTGDVACTSKCIAVRGSPASFFFGCATCVSDTNRP
jgi:hypothetical protein